MKTTKGNTFANLLDVQLGEKSVTFNMPYPIDYTVPQRPEGQPALVDWVTDIISREKKGAVVVEKCLEQIELHRDLLVKAYGRLFDSYTYATTPQTRTNSADRARMDMLSALPDKLLRLNAEVYLSEEVMSNIILPDDRGKLIDLVLEAMKKGDSK